MIWLSQNQPYIKGGFGHPSPNCSPPIWGGESPDHGMPCLSVQVLTSAPQVPPRGEPGGLLAGTSDLLGAPWPPPIWGGEPLSPPATWRAVGPGDPGDNPAMPA